MDLAIVICILIIPLIAQLMVTSNYNKYKKIELSKPISGCEVARKILDENALSDIHVVESKGGTLSDHYDPARKVVRLSTDVFHGETVAAAAIAAHEVGHAIQDKKGYAYMKFRAFIFPAVNVATKFSYIMILLGLLTELTQWFYIGIVLMLLGLVFQLVTLPVEFDASKRAKEELKKYNIVSEDENEGANKVLGAAAMTYIAGVLANAANILRLILMFSNKRD